MIELGKSLIEERKKSKAIEIARSLFHFIIWRGELNLYFLQSNKRE